ncbi:MAG TPA: hypothetical protein VF515_16630 [Candidatus Binatia bacterium]
MKLRNACRIVSVVTLGVPLLVGTARAVDSYSQTINQAPAAAADTTPVNTSDFQIKAGGNKLMIKSAKAADLGGMVTTLTLKNVNCPAEGNDKDKPFKCGVKTPLTPVLAVLDLSVQQFLTPTISPQGIDWLHVAGVPIQFVQGKASFVANGLNHVTANDVFGALASSILGQPLGVGSIAIRTLTPAQQLDCAVAPPGPTCLAGAEFGFAGIMVAP